VHAEAASRTNNVTVVCVAKYHIEREALAALLRSTNLFERVVAADWEGVAAGIRPAIVVASTGAGEVRHLQQIRVITNLDAVPVVALVSEDDQALLLTLLQSGASGIVLKSSSIHSVLSAISSTFQGRKYIDPHLQSTAQVMMSAEISTGTKLLSDREELVLKFVAQGFGNKDIAQKLGVGVKTIESYRTRVREKLKLRGRHELVNYALLTGLLSQTVG
jgi:two-component system, NarL family, response regulator NreC